MSHNILVDRFLPPASIAQYPGIIDAIENAVRQTACLSTTSDAPRFADFESFIPVQTEKPVNDALLLVVDVGGTYTKVALRYHQTNHTDWFPLFKARNYEITPESGADRFVRMLDALFSLTIDKLSEHNTNADQIQGISVVWSNALNCYPLDPADRGLVGVSGVIKGKDSGEFYLKGEPWLDSICDGNDIGVAFIEAAHRVGLSPKAFIIGNDTILTQKAWPAATAGAVLSTGANSTIVLRGEKLLRNAESGNSFLIADRWQHPADCLPGQELTLEHMIAGRGMQHRFAHHLLHLTRTSECEQHCNTELWSCLQKIRGHLEPQQTYLTAFKGKDLQAVLKQDFDRFLELRGERRELYEPMCVRELLTAIAENLVQRGAELGALMLYASVYSQLSAGEGEIAIGLDSSQARLLPSYLDQLRTCFAKIVSERFPDHPGVSIKLLEPDGLIAVPMLGAAAAVNDFLVFAERNDQNLNSKLAALT